MNCKAFIIDVARSGCFSVQPGSDDFVPEPNVTFYHKICVKGISWSFIYFMFRYIRKTGALYRISLSV